MPTLVLRRPPNDQQSEARSRLRQALAAVHEEEDRIQALEAGQSRAHEAVRHSRQAILDAEQSLRGLRTVEPTRLAFAFINGEELQDRQTVGEAEALLDRLKSEHAHSQEIDQALEGELRSAETRLRLRRGALYQALSELICSSPELEDLFADLEQTWARLRGLRKCFDHITTALHGQMPAKLMSRWQVSPPLDPSIIGYPLDEQRYRRWASALEALLADADAELPSAGD
jgi:hypothetical protein